MNVNVVFTGHVDHGKSTLIGRLLYDSDSIKEGQVTEIQKLAEEYKRRFEFAYFLDAFDDELKEERTIDTTKVMFKGKNLYTVTDVPGHKEFIKNMLTGASHADVAVLVVSAEEGVQEQTGRHAFLIHMLGIKDLSVAVNKMDTVKYDKAVFAKIRKDVTKLLQSLGYRDLNFIPVSAIEGDNVYKKSEAMSWYSGPTLIEALDTIRPAKIETKPLRFVVQDNYTVNSDRIIVGRVESGILHKGDEVVFQPSTVKGKVEDIRVFNGKLEKAQAGDSIGLVIDCNPNRGDVCGLITDPPVASNQFTGEAVLLNNYLRQGEILQLRCGTRKVRCEVKQIQERINSETGVVIEKYPQQIRQHDAATIVFATEPLVVEKFSNIPELGRFILIQDKNIGAGVVLEAAR